MERQLWKAIVRVLSEVDKPRHNVRCTYSAVVIVKVWMWSVIHDRPVSWACDRSNWPPYEQRWKRPSCTTMSRRLRCAEVRALLQQIEQRVLRPQGVGNLVWIIDGKPLVISGCSKDRQGGYGRAASGKAKGYKVHAIVGSDGSVAAWRVAPMNKDERVMARRMLATAEIQGYVLADSNYDSNKLHEVCDSRGNLLVRGRVSGGRKRKNVFLLGRYVRCAACGYVMTGQRNKDGRLYYRHPSRHRVKDCRLKEPRPWVPAERLDREVVSMLFDTLGNPALLERAAKAAVPDCDELTKERERVLVDVAKIERARQRILNQIEHDNITDEEAESSLRNLRDRKTACHAKLEYIESQLAHVPDARAVQVFVEHLADGLILVYDQDGYPHPGGNDLCTWLDITTQDRCALVQAAFAAPLPDGTLPGVYVSPLANGKRFRPKSFSFTLRGAALPPEQRVTAHALP